MLATGDISSRFSLDVQSVGQLRTQIKSDPLKTAKAAAQQFEAMFLNMMLKSMRDATPGEGLFDDNNTKLYVEMLDSQLAQSISKSKGIGLADMIVRQMEAQGMIPKASGDGTQKSDGGMSLANVIRSPGMPLVPTPKERPVTTSTEVAAPEAEKVAALPVLPSQESDFSDPADFVNKLWPHAVEASKELGIPAHFLLGHAALETGWGKKQIHDASGNPSYNLFGIKAGGSWSGNVAEALTTEYQNGVAQKKSESFRAYGSYKESFLDYAKLLRNNPRYSGLFEGNLDGASFAQGLQKAGYATDPMYARKLAGVISSTTMRTALAG